MSKGGAPTKYKPEFCDMLIDHLEKGYSFESFAGVARVCKDTLYDWVKANAEFLYAKKVGTELSRLYWETLAIDHMNGRVSQKDKELIIDAVSDRTGPVTIRFDNHYFNNTIWIFNMKNRFKQEWRDKQELEHSGPDGKPMQSQPITLIIPDNRRNAKKSE